MHAVAMFMTQLPVANRFSSISEGQEMPSTFSFQHVFDKQMVQHTQGQGTALADGDTSLNEEVLNKLKQLLDKFSDNPKLLEEELQLLSDNLFKLEIPGLDKTNLNELIHILQQSIETVQIDELSSIDNLLIMIDALISENNKQGNAEETAVVVKNLNEVPNFQPEANIFMGVIPESSLQKELSVIWLQAESLLSNIQSKEDIKQMAPKLLVLLQQWAGLEKQGTAINQNFTHLQLPDSKEQQLWKELVQFYGKREQIAAKQLYSVNSKVTSVDVTKLLESAMDRYGLKEVSTNQPVTFQTSIPLHRTEQYVIYVNQNETTQAVDKQLLEQFQKIMKSSKFLAQPNGINQLSIRLQPENLGQMMVRLTQVDGEMLVKISVTTQAAKEMLEKNIHQLRNMFSPHQVVIERQETTVQQSGHAQKGQGEEQQQNQSEEHSKQRNDHNEQPKDEEFETLFKEILNEKV